MLNVKLDLRSDLAIYELVKCFLNLNESILLNFSMESEIYLKIVSWRKHVNEGWRIGDTWQYEVPHNL